MLIWPSSSGCSAIRACVAPWRAAISIVARMALIMSCMPTGPADSAAVAPDAEAALAGARTAASSLDSELTSRRQARLRRRAGLRDRSHFRCPRRARHGCRQRRGRRSVGARLAGTGAVLATRPSFATAGRGSGLGATGAGARSCRGIRVELRRRRAGSALRCAGARGCDRSRCCFEFGRAGARRRGCTLRAAGCGSACGAHACAHFRCA